MRALMSGSGDVSDQSALFRALGKLAGLTGITKSPGRIRDLSRRFLKFLPMTRNVVVIGGSLVGLELAEFFAERGKSVTVLESGAQLGLPMALPRRWHAVRRAADHGVRLERQATLEEITPTSVVYRDAEDRQRTAAADLVVVASEVSSGAPLAKELADRGVAVEVVGDAGEVGYIQGAVHSAWRVARDL